MSLFLPFSPSGTRGKKKDKTYEREVSEGILDCSDSVRDGVRGAAQAGCRRYFNVFFFLKVGSKKKKGKH